MNKYPKVTLLISTYNWPEALALVLKSILKQTVIPEEIIIADDGSSEQTKILIENFNKEHRLSIKHVWHEDRGFRKSIIVNKAIQTSSNPYIIQIDGDIVLHKRFIEDHKKAAKPGYFIAGSRAAIGEKRSNEILKSGFLLSLNPFSSGMDTRFNAIRFPFLSFLFSSKSNSSWNVKGCNFAFWKQDYIDVNGYYNGFKGWGWEDYELAQRLVNKGIKKRKLKWAAVCYHIFHPLSARTNTKPNEFIYRETIAHKMRHRSPGFHEVVGI
ncbi:glycosyltransferase family 2 protein [Sphingobacterium chuzhouense]|uniref:Glycosyltransferase family 2 protein n=1 Tax=Sphingobacterium chuzhouense TaxID=1742264 RepID=A0ABR7XM49_9SPHI|nr:glycosyltransferase family 2 protein [Sphingobacterium chuzhouense]MBD1420240.1 glycosyltransferase family 2 protein [Sphingobacterium chuzhouense]